MSRLGRLVDPASESSGTGPTSGWCGAVSTRQTSCVYFPDSPRGRAAAIAFSTSASMKLLSDSFAGRRRVGAALLLAVLGASGTGLAAGDPDAVSLDAARAEHEAGRAVLIDIREPAEHATGIARGARPLPMSQLSRRVAEIPTDPKKPVLLICNTQNRSSATLRALRQHGYSHVRYVNGGMSEWARRGWPLVKPGS
jgi:rhodanese-related sulfurtransferase